MKYFIDTEFIEGFHKPLFGKKRHFIDLISIGIVDENENTFYRISNEYNYSDADDWVKENVILPLYLNTVSGDARNRHSVDNFHLYFGKSNAGIAEDIKDFISQRGKIFEDVNMDAYDLYDSRMDILKRLTGEIQFYGYYGDYDWVLFCSLFGRMIDLPKGVPMYCLDLKQNLDEVAMQKIMEVENKYRGESRFETSLRLIKNSTLYPKQNNEHNALADAKWNYELFKFLKAY